MGWDACWKPSAACLAASATFIWIERVEAVVGGSLCLRTGHYLRLAFLEWAHLISHTRFSI